MLRLLIAVLFVFGVLWPARGGAQPISVDHVFVFVSPNAPEARVLQDLGLTVVQDTSRHAGQGTASLSVMFHNAYLELIWIDNAAEFRGIGLGMPERRADPSGSPFGIGLKHTDLETAIPFATDSYTADWMRDSEPIQMATWSRSVAEPLIFVVPQAMRWDIRYEQRPALQAYTRHELELRELTGVRLVGPSVTTASETLRVLGSLGVLQLAEAATHTMHLTFDDGNQGTTLDLRPTLPVVLHY